MSNVIIPTTLSEEEFDRRFNIKEFPHGDKFETEAEIKLLNTLLKKYPNQVWSCVDGDFSELIFENRLAVVNRNYYFFTEEPYGEDENLTVEIVLDFD